MLWVFPLIFIFIPSPAAKRQGRNIRIEGYQPNKKKNGPNRKYTVKYRDIISAELIGTGLLTFLERSYLPKSLFLLRFVPRVKERHTFVL